MLLTWGLTDRKVVKLFCCFQPDGVVWGATLANLTLQYYLLLTTYYLLLTTAEDFLSQSGKDKKWLLKPYCNITVTSPSGLRLIYRYLYITYFISALTIARLWNWVIQNSTHPSITQPCSSEGISIVRYGIEDSFSTTGIPWLSHNINSSPPHHIYLLLSSTPDYLISLNSLSVLYISYHNNTVTINSSTTAQVIQPHM